MYEFIPISFEFGFFFLLIKSIVTITITITPMAIPPLMLEIKIINSKGIPRPPSSLESSSESSTGSGQV